MLDHRRQLAAMVKLGSMREHGRVVCDFEENVHHMT
jgi:hypothetical protein